MSTSILGKGPIFVSGADGEKASAIVEQILHFPQKYHYLAAQTVYAGVPDASTARAKQVEALGAELVAFDIFNDHARAVSALQKVTKLCLVIDPLSHRINRSNAYDYGKKFIDAAKEANIQHIIFLTPFSPLDPVSPPVTPSAEISMLNLNEPQTFRSQFMLIESYLRSQFDSRCTTILRYPGILHQHLVVFRKYIMEHNAFPVPHRYLENTVETSNMLDIARAVACIAHSPVSRHGNQAYKVTGPQLLTLQELSTRVLIGLRRDVAVNTMDMPTLKQILCDSIGNEEHVVFLLEMWGLQQKLHGRRFEVTRDLEALTGQSGKTLNEFFEDDSVFASFMSANPCPFVA
ncbi:uncharacterized protein BYT42DRAFT_545571 [Radiomyces spectabilis]|uniref:uncharacterized protein n=1 Tax=Radiomyces spectabilis TaxID=64574 RepID=UPI0022207D7E|nr:uncharacterized protein BYT42DRAFT_545571 [Radiomyces spectabilis]KAI8379169.1 hypothetical protein BYT42DRAFT_545571 [Radiomyces spectabilis]